MSKTEITRDSVPTDPNKIYREYRPQLEGWKEEGGSLGVVAEAIESIATRGENQ